MKRKKKKACEMERIMEQNKEIKEQVTNLQSELFEMRQILLSVMAGQHQASDLGDTGQTNV